LAAFAASRRPFAGIAAKTMAASLAASAAQEALRVAFFYKKN
jgi:hypothetical protein